MSIPDQPVAVPARVEDLARGADLVCVWDNDYGGLTFRATPAEGETFYIKWGPRNLEFSLVHIDLLIASYGVHSTDDFPLACFIVPANKLIANNVAAGHHDSIYLFLLRKDNCIYALFGARDPPGL